MYMYVVDNIVYSVSVQIVKKNVIENLVPIVIAAKHMFEQQHSPLLKDMLKYLKELMQVRVVYTALRTRSNQTTYTGRVSVNIDRDWLSFKY